MSVVNQKKGAPKSLTLHPIRLPGFCTVYLLHGTEGAVLIDAGPPGQADRIMAGIAAAGVQPEDVRLILITHGHTDHFGSAAALRERLDAPVAVHADDAAALQAGAHVEGSLTPTSRVIALLTNLPFNPIEADAPPVTPDQTFKAPWRLDRYGIPGEVVLTPGHTPGSITVLLDDGRAIVGDLVMADWGRLGRRPGPPMVAWDLARNRESLREVLAHGPHTFYLTHGGPFQRDAVDAYLKRSATS